MGNHTYSHPELDLLTAQKYERDIARNEPTLARVDPGGDWHWFRYPYLEEGDTVEKREHVLTWLKQHHYRVAEISLDFQDYNWNDTYARCAVKHDTAAIARLHDTYLDGAARATVVFRELAHMLYGHDIPYVLLLHVGAFDARMLPELIAQFRASGFTFVTLPEAEADPAYAFDPAVPTKGGSTFLEQVATSRKVHVPELPDYSAELDKACR
jgi:peptidoglycan/xylan/chitin deacetylase (PgdA/CDA1 family)